MLPMYMAIGEYDRSDEISLRTMKESIHCYRMNLLAANLYNNVWNYEQRIKNDIPVRQGYQGEKFLKRCITLCQMIRNTAWELIISKKCK